jgi:predicted dehydrogenase
MSLFGVLGSGFGLYGYLPALVSCNQRVALPKRYQPHFAARPELAQFAANVDWKEDENAVLKQATGIVLALKPSLQTEWLHRCLEHSHMNHLVLEKPLAQSPEIAAVVFRRLVNADKTFRIAYTFRFTPWGKALLSLPFLQKQPGKLYISWSFSAHHFRQNVHTWKRTHAEGGAVIRFYGIHLIALLAEMGYRFVARSQAVGEVAGEFYEWKAQLRGDGLPDCTIAIDSKSAVNRLQVSLAAGKSIESEQAIIADLRDPFDQETQGVGNGLLDQRVAILTQLCQTLWEPSQSDYNWYAATLGLWQEIEDKTEFQIQSNERKP